MKGTSRNYRGYLNIFLILLLFAILSGCTGSTPVINSFFATPSTIVAGESVTLSWTVTDADTVSIDYGIGTVSLTGITTVTPTTDTTYTLMATNSAGTITATATVTVSPIETLTLQPGSEGKDAYVSTYASDTNFGSSTYLSAGDDGFYYRAYLQFDLDPNPLPSGAIITDAILKLYQISIPQQPVTFNGGLYPVTSNWEEDEITWNNQPTSSSTFVALPTLYETTGTWVTCHIPDFVKGWLNGSITNYGLLIKATDELLEDTRAYFSSSDSIADITKHPILEIDYYIP